MLSLQKVANLMPAKMGEQAPQKKKFNTELTDYSEVHKENTGPYANDLEVDALVVGGGFGESLLYHYVRSCANLPFSQVACSC